MKNSPKKRFPQKERDTTIKEGREQLSKQKRCCFPMVHELRSRRDVCCPSSAAGHTFWKEVHQSLRNRGTLVSICAICCTPGHVREQKALPLGCESSASTCKVTLSSSWQEACASSCSIFYTHLKTSVESWWSMRLKLISKIKYDAPHQSEASGMCRPKRATPQSDSATLVEPSLGLHFGVWHRFLLIKTTVAYTS